MESAPEVQHRITAIVRIVEMVLHWSASVVFHTMEGSDKVETEAEETSSSTYLVHWSKKKKQKSHGQNIEKGVQTLTIVTRELMIFFPLLTPLF